MRPIPKREVRTEHVVGIGPFEGQDWWTASFSVDDPNHTWACNGTSEIDALRKLVVYIAENPVLQPA